MLQEADNNGKEGRLVEAVQQSVESPAIAAQGGQDSCGQIIFDLTIWDLRFLLLGAKPGTTKDCQYYKSKPGHPNDPNAC